jgi:myo-inositol-1(or 4)-monophosphatase
MTDAHRPYLDFVAETAYLAGRVTLEHFQTDFAIERKADQTPVTIADREAERLIRSRIESSFPDHAIVGEEFGASGRDDAAHRWYVDPIDGTKAFVAGIPSYSVLIGLEIDGRVEVGAACFPGLDELIVAATDAGCWWNGAPARASATPSLAEGTLTFTDVNTFAAFGRSEVWERLRQRAYHRVGWGDAYGHCLVATGRAELMLDPVMTAWDAGPLPVILREAGGFFGDWQGNETIHADEGLSTTQTLLPEVLELIHGDGASA